MKKNIHVKYLIALGALFTQTAQGAQYIDSAYGTATGATPSDVCTPDSPPSLMCPGTSTGYMAPTEPGPVGPTYCELYPEQCFSDEPPTTTPTPTPTLPPPPSATPPPTATPIPPPSTPVPTLPPPPSATPPPTSTGGYPATPVPPPSTPVPVGTPAPGTITYFNPTLNGCIQAIRPTSSTYVRTTSEFDCPHTPTDSVGVTNAADKDYKQWNDHFLPGSSATPMDGAYSLHAQRCGDQSALSVNCPISMRVKYVYTCDKGDTMNWSASLGRCAIARSLKVYRATYQAISVPGKMSIKPIIIADKNVTPDALEAAPVPMSGISSINYSGKVEIKCSDYQKPGDAPYFQVGQDPYGNPICSQDATVTEMQKQICNQMMSGIWSTGGTSASPCPIISVSKVFKLNNTGKTDKTTTDCTNAGGKIFTSSGAEVAALGAYPGGTLSGAITSESEFRTKYSISTASPTFTCKVKTTSNQTQEFNASGVLLLKNFVAGSLTIDGMVGGGAGGGSSDQDNGGIGGGASAFVSGPLYSVVSDQSCTVTIGSGGVGANANVSCCARAADGGATRVACAEQASQAAGGIRGSEGNDGCRGSPSGSGGASSYYGSGGSGPNCGVGGTATSYGAGGGGGGTEGVTCGCRSGGTGAGGYVKASWKIFNWVNW
jgi:hypothetical protein